MVIGTFPLMKLGILLVRQISKPVAGYIKEGAKRSPVFRNYVCLPTAQFYHWAETRYKLFIMGFGKPVQVTPLKEEVAIELGADILGEFFIFGTAAAALTFEYVRSSAKSRAKEEVERQRILNLESKVIELDLTQEQLRAQLRELERHMHSSPLQALKEKLAPFGPSSKSDQKPSAPAPGSDAPSSSTTSQASKAPAAGSSTTSGANQAEGTHDTVSNHFGTLSYQVNANANDPHSSATAAQDEHVHRSKMMRRALKILMDAYEEYDED